MQEDKNIDVPHEATKDMTTEDAGRASRWAIICKLNPGGLTGDARKINEQKLALEGQ